MRVLVFAAHPDDEVLGLGGTVARHVRAGDQVTVVFVTEGASVRYGAEAVTRHQDQARAACRTLEVRDLRFLGMPDQGLDGVPIIEVIRPMEGILAETRAEVVYMHHLGDLNRDHRIVGEAALVATRPVNGGVRRVLAYETPSSTEWGAPDPARRFTPTYFVDVSSTIERKLEAVAHYVTELRAAPHPRSAAALKSRAEYWGQIAGVSYAEPFVLVRELVR